MTAKQLKNSILQMAVQGKLVPQDPSDEPASVLLEKIKAEKRKLVKEGKIKKEKVNWNTTDELPQLPKGWIWCRLGEVCQKIGSGSTPLGGRNVYKSSGIPFLRSQNIIDDSVDLSDVVYISEEINEKMSSTEVKSGDILLNITGASLGRCALVSDNFSMANVSQHVSIIRMVDDNLRFYIHKLFLSPLIQNLIWSRQVGMAREGLSKATLQQFEIPLPPLPEQRRIVAALNQILPKISDYEKAETQIQQLNSSFPANLKKSILQSAIQGKLVPQNPDEEPASVLLERIRAERRKLVEEGKLKKDKVESRIFRGSKDIEGTKPGRFYEQTGKSAPVDITDELPFEIPESWEWARLGNICQLLSGRDLNNDEYHDIEDGIPYITGASNIDNKKIIINRWTKKPCVIALKDDLIFSCKGSIGKFAFLQVEKVHIARQLMALRNLYKLNFTYIMFVIECNTSHFQKKAQGLIPGITREAMLDIIIPVPPLDEQNRIVDKLTQLLNAEEMIYKLVG